MVRDPDGLVQGLGVAGYDSPAREEHQVFGTAAEVHQVKNGSTKSPNNFVYKSHREAIVAP